jgi:hypothetical protein
MGTMCQPRVDGNDVRMMFHALVGIMCHVLMGIFGYVNVTRLPHHMSSHMGSLDHRQPRPHNAAVHVLRDAPASLTVVLASKVPGSVQLHQRRRGAAVRRGCGFNIVRYSRP